MEVSIGEYGRMIFQMMLERKPDGHWASIAEKARPLVQQLIALNDEMKPNGYEIIGVKDMSGKKKLSKAKRIEKAQKAWLARAGDLKEGDMVWLYKHYDHEMHLTSDDPVPVIDVTKKGVYVEMSGFNCEFVEKLDSEEMVLKAPKDYDEKADEYQSEEYWLKLAEEKGF